MTRPSDGAWPWVAAAWPSSLDAETRAELAAAAELAGGGRVVVRTCHRVEIYGRGPRHGLDGGWERDEVTVLEGPAAARHLLRLAAGLDSAIVGEDQVLHQVRVALAAARRAGPLDPRLGRLFELAIATGRRSRSGRPGRSTLARRAVDRLEGIAGPLAGRQALVVGAGAMGRDLARVFAARGAEVVVASRTRDRAVAVAEGVGGLAVELEAAAGLAPTSAALGVALGGPWPAAASVELPPTVDLSSPPALPQASRERLGGRHIGIDDLAAGAATDGVRPPDQADPEYAAGAEALVAAAAANYERWLGARRSVPTLRAIAARAERQRASDLEALLRRLPGLDDRERREVERFSRQLVARLIHPPVARLGADGDGSARAAVHEVFDL